MIGTRWFVLLAFVAATECYQYVQSYYSYRRGAPIKARPMRQQGARDMYSRTSRKDFDSVDDLIAPEIHLKIHGDLINLWENAEDDKQAQKAKEDVGKLNVKAKDHMVMLCARTKRAAKKKRNLDIPTKEEIEKPLKNEEDESAGEEEDAPNEDIKREEVDSTEEDPDGNEPEEQQPEAKDKDKVDGKRSNVYGDYVRREGNIDVNSVYYLAALSQRDKETLARQLAQKFFERNFQHVLDFEENERMKNNEKLKETILAIAEELKDEPRANISDDLLMQLKNAIRKTDESDDS